VDPLIFGLFAVAYIASLILGFKKHSKTASAILFLTIIGLIYDNGVLAIGHLIGEGILLENLNLGRFWIHALFTPTLLLFSLFILREAGIHIAFKTWFVVSFVVLWIVATIVEIIVEIRGLELTVQESYGVLSYAAVETASGPPPMILIVLIGLLIAGILLAWKKKWWWMLVGTIAMTIGSAVPFDIGSDAATNAFELFLIITLLWTAIRFSNQKST
jgi:hypothetical protein